MDNQEVTFDVRKKSQARGNQIAVFLTKIEQQRTAVELFLVSR